MMIIVMLHACTTPSSVRQHPEFASQRNTFNTVFLVPPQVEIIHDVSYSGIRSPEEEKITAEDLREIVEAELKQLGFQIKKEQTQPIVTARKATTHTPIVCKQLTNILNTGAVKINTEKPRADALALMCLKEYKRSSGDIAVESSTKILLGLATLGVVTIPKDPSGWANLKVALINGKNGELLWANQVADTSFRLIGEPHFNVKALVADLFKPFPRLDGQE